MPITPEKFPINQDLSGCGPEYSPEVFTAEEQRILKPFFTNFDRPVFISKNLPEEVVAALSSKYSRSVLGLRRMFIKEYANVVLHPEEQKNWGSVSEEEQKEKLMVKEQFNKWLNFINDEGGIETVVNAQRARSFFKEWLTGYGDDSIQELGGVHIFIEGASNVVTQVVEDKRVSVAILEKSSRYVPFGDLKGNGEFRFMVPSEIKGTPLEKEYRLVMSDLFQLYNEIGPEYLGYIKDIYPQGPDEDSGSFDRSRLAKRFDDTRDLLPFSTETNVALYANARTYEDIINKMLANPLKEVQWWGQQMARELNLVIPSLMEKLQSDKGAERQIYRSNIDSLRESMFKRLFGDRLPVGPKLRVKLLNFTPDADVAVLSAFLFSGNHGFSKQEIESELKNLSVEERFKLLGGILAERQFGRETQDRAKDRFNKPSRSFENVHYQFELFGRGGDYRDLHRNRMGTQERKRFTARYGYDLETDVIESPIIDRVRVALNRTENLFKKLEKISPDVAQYAVPYAFLQHWYLEASARAIYWNVELRTGPQGRPHYREILQIVAKLAKEASPAVFQGLLVDNNQYGISRRESEKRKKTTS